MGASVRPDLVEQELARIRASGSVDVEAELAKIRQKPPVPQDAVVPELPFGKQWLQRAAGGLSTGLSMLPGGEAYQALVRGAIRQQPYSEALADIRLAQEEAPAITKAPAQAAGMVASIPLTPARAGGAAIGAGFGGATRALSAEDESLWDRVKGTALAAGTGAAVGAVLPAAMKFAPTRVATGAATGALLAGEGNRAEGAVAGGVLLANPSYMARAVSDATRRVAPAVSGAMRNISEATGIRGAVNKEMEGIQSILRPLGGVVGAGETAAPTLLGARAAQEVTSAQNYGMAATEGDAALRAYQAHRGNIVNENVSRMLNIISRDSENAAAMLHGPVKTAQAVPSVREAIENLRVQSAEVARRQTPRISESPFVRNTRAETATQAGMRPAVDRQIAAEGPNPLLNTTADFPPPQTPLPGMLDEPSAVHPLADNLYNNPTIQRVANGLRKLEEFAGMEPDDPRFLDSLYKVFSDQKGALAQRIEGATGISPVNLGRFTERDITGAQKEILAVADELMPTYRTAVTEHAKASSWMDAYRRGYSMVRTGSNAAKNLTQKTPAATEDWIARQVDKKRPELADAARQGARAGMADVIGATPLVGGRAEILQKQPFTTSPIDAAKRKAAMGPGADEFERMLAEVRTKTAEVPYRVYLPGAGGHVASSVWTRLQRPALETPAAQTLLGEVTRNPAAYQGILAQAKKGETLLDVIRRTTTAQAGGAAGRR